MASLSGRPPSPVLRASLCALLTLACTSKTVYRTSYDSPVAADYPEDPMPAEPAPPRTATSSALLLHQP
jgi:hypothetical protein